MRWPRPSGNIPDGRLKGFFIRLGEACYNDVSLSRRIELLLRNYGTSKSFGELAVSVEPDVMIRGIEPIVAPCGTSVQSTCANVGIESIPLGE